MSFAVVVSDIAPLYTKPEPLCELADEALYGMVVEVLAREGMYCRVRTHYRYEGWTPARCLLEDGAPAAQWQSVPKLVVQKPYIDVLNSRRYRGLPAEHAEGSFLCPEGGPDETSGSPFVLRTDVSATPKQLIWLSRLPRGKALGKMNCGSAYAAPHCLIWAHNTAGAVKRRWASIAAALSPWPFCSTV
ncbi:MAG: hypothetical protein ACLRRT_06830 [Ruthenibacterium lactatiformans]